VAEPGAPADTARGPGRVLVAVYGVFALAAGARAAVQLATRFDEAPLAYLLSAVAAVVYVVATAGLARGGQGGRRTAVTACSVELAGVLVVGTASLVDPAAFPDSTVWSGYGSGYGFIPLVLPVLGLLWLRHQAEEAAGQKPPPLSPPKSPPPMSPPPQSPPSAE
jgi:cytochrome bd-type quinol oxidase subunit 2